MTETPKMKEKVNTQSAKQNLGVRWWVKRLALLLLVFVLAILSIGAMTKSKLMKRYPAPGQMVDVGGYKMHLYCTGPGRPTVILVAGLDDFSVMWSSVQTEVARTMRVCSFDRSGLGWSEPSSAPRTSENMVKELHALLDTAKVESPYVLVGHSFGGALVRLYAHDYPNEVAGMVLVDAAPDDLFLRIPQWRNAIGGKLGLYRTLAPLSSFGLLAFAPESIPNRGMPEDVLAQYRAVAVSTGYFQTGVAENEAFENNLAEIRAANVNLGDMPLSVISRGYLDPMPGFSDTDNQQAWQLWQEMQTDLLSLSSNGRQIIATESEHSIHLQQPQLVIGAIKDVVEAARK
jgi:pimeloyl-ACP methyl ester carboxylesterase